MSRWTPPRVARFAGALFVGLAVLTVTAFVGVRETTRRWFESDLELRSHLAVTAASQALVAAWHSDPAALTAILEDLTRDERILGATACGRAGAVVAQTGGYPAELGCRVIVAGMAARGGRDEWATTRDLPTGRVHVTAITIGPDPAADALGLVVLVHDLSFVQRREATARNLLLAGFVVLALGGSLVTVLAARFAWQEWTLGLRRALHGDAAPQFRPLVRDVRELMERVARAAGTGRGGPWTPERLYSILTEHLRGSAS